METWKAVPGFEEYEVSDLGRIRKNGRMLNGSKRKDGYIQIRLGGRDGPNWLLHRLVLFVFEGPCPGMIARHRNDDRSNNALSNLCYGTPKDNAEDRVANARKRGAVAAAAKMTQEQILAICERLDKGDRFADIARDFGTTEGTISNINRGSTWGWLTGRDLKHARKGAHKNTSRKLNEEVVRKIAERIRNGEQLKRIANDVGVRAQTILDIKQGEIWNHVTGFKEAA